MLLTLLAMVADFGFLLKSQKRVNPMVRKIWTALWLPVAVLAMIMVPGTAGAGQKEASSLFSIDKMENQFSKLTGRIIDGPQGHLLLNRGSVQGVKQGDVWTLFLSPRPVKDPETGEILGQFAPPAALARIRQVHERFSEVDVKCLENNDCDISSGTRAVRYQNVKAWFADKDSPAPDLYAQLQKRFNHLDWQAHDSEVLLQPEKDPFAHGVVFEVSHEMLTVWSGGQLRETYRLFQQAPAGNQPSAHSPAAGIADMPGMGTPLEVTGFAPVISIDQKIRHMGVARSSDSETVWLIVLSQSRITAQSLSGDKSFDFDYSGFGQMVNLSAAGNHLLAVSIFDQDAGMRSMLLEITDTGFKKKAENIDYLLAFIKGADPDDPAQLWGQRFSLKDLLLPVVYRLEVENDSVLRGSRIEVPYGFSLMGSFSGDFNGNGIAELGFFNKCGQLMICEKNEVVWESSEKFAGSHGSFLVQDPDDPGAAPAKVEIRGQPAVFTINNRICAALALNQAGLSTMIGGGPSQGTVGVFSGQRSYYRLEKIADRFQGSIQDVAVSGDKLLICVAEGGLFSRKGRCHIISVPLANLVP
jgi:hypothetical protein